MTKRQEDEDDDPYTLSVARSIVRAKEIFEQAHHLRTSENSIPGCGYLTWHDLWALHDYAARKFNAEESAALAKEVK